MANQLAFVTGASAGIGYNLAKVLAERKYDLVITAEQEKLSQAADDFRAHGVSVTAIQADARKPEEVERVWSEIQSLHRNLDIACINAGIGEGGLFAVDAAGHLALPFNSEGMYRASRNAAGDEAVAIYGAP